MQNEYQHIKKSLETQKDGTVQYQIVRSFVLFRRSTEGDKHEYT